jgi:hypothetical protein
VSETNVLAFNSIVFHFCAKDAQKWGTLVSLTETEVGRLAVQHFAVAFYDAADGEGFFSGAFQDGLSFLEFFRWNDQ